MAQVLEFKLPDLGEGLTEAEIVRWLVEVGDVVAVDQPVVEVETAKAMVEVPCPYGGVVTARFGAEGTELPVGAPLLTVAVGETADGRPAGDGSGAGTAAADGARDGASGGREPAAEGSGNVLVGYGTSQAPARRRRVRPAAPAVNGRSRAPEPVRETRPGGHPAGRTGCAGRPHGVGGRPGPRDLPAGAQAGPGKRLGSAETGRFRPRRADPARGRGARAARRGHPGPHGDDGRHRTGRDHHRGHPRDPGGDRWAARSTAGAASVTRVPLKGIRGAVADKLSRSRTEIPDATCWVDADATELMRTRAAMNAAGGPKISVLALLARICTAALTRFPELNASVDTGAREIVRYADVHLGFAAQTERGLVVPVVRDAHTRDAESLTAEFARLTEAARAGTLTPAELTGGTFTLNNYGVFGVDGSTPIINHPEAAMLGVGRIVPKPWVHEGELAVRQVVQLSLTFDHRVCDGGTAGGFLRYVADCVEQPAVLLRTV
ncbi:2-oxo acid dehydrogenase subunit E2 [Streptomyces albogriseolus]|nr:2-oxo acid dehydrogenase subunit E2 [Streptomyces albogriseolus]